MHMYINHSYSDVIIAKWWSIVNRLEICWDINDIPPVKEEVFNFRAQLLPAITILCCDALGKLLSILTFRGCTMSLAVRWDC